jgi:hypothetical protein
MVCLLSLIDAHQLIRIDRVRVDGRPSSRGQAKAVWRMRTNMAYTRVYARGQESDHATQGEGLHE